MSGHDISVKQTRQRYHTIQLQNEEEKKVSGKKKRGPENKR
jgi:hypothetical protein